MTYRGVEVEAHHSCPRYYMEVSGQLHAPATYLEDGALIPIR
jgi:hypothetical protein